MSKWQESPPLSRRELRERERRAAGGQQRTQTDEDAAKVYEAEHGERMSEQMSERRATPQREEPVNPFAFDPPAASMLRPTPARAEHFETAPAGDFEVPEHTMTRRQLRELREAQAAAAKRGEPVPTSLESAASQNTPPQTGRPAAADSGTDTPTLRMTTFPEKTLPYVPGGGLATEPQPEPDAATRLIPAQAETPEQGPAQAETRIMPAATSPTVAPEASASPKPHAPAPAWPADRSPAPAFDELIAPRAEDDDHGVTGNTLILSAVPAPDAPMRPVGKSGEALETGSIELPHSLASTGQHARFDSSELDRMFDHDEHSAEGAQSHSAGIEPVRARSAVSTHTSTRDVVTPTNNKEHRLPIVLAASAGVMAVGVLGMFVAGAIFGVF